MLSTIILNWNRDYLLRQCIESYLDTVGPDYELMIIDNGSDDGSRDYIKTIIKTGSIRAIFLPNNRGGEAFNLAIRLANGELVQLCENDQLFLPGWRDQVDQAFASFPDLGQLCLLADTPTDQEAWEPKPSHLRFANGTILYEAHSNVSTSSIIRSILFRRHHLRVHNVKSNNIKFPDDYRLSKDIQNAGFWCAWSDRYYVRNLGHEIPEFSNNVEYYTENYANKPRIGVAGWHRRIEQQRELPKVARSSLAFPDRVPIPEKTTNAVDDKPARLWSMFDGFTAEMEVLDFLMVFTRLIKPSEVLETGTWLGLSACAIGRGLVANGFGRLTTIEVNPEAHRFALNHIEQYGLTAIIDARLISSMEFEPDRQYDMVLFDSELSLRVAEFRRLRPWLKRSALVLFHDTSVHHHVVLEGIRQLIAEGAVAGINLPTPRGIFIGENVP